MRRGTVLGGLLLVGCSGVSTPPEEYAVIEPPRYELTPEQRLRVESLAARAVRGADEGLFETAEEAARSAIDVDPRAARARAVLGLCLLRRSLAADPPDLALQARGEGESLLAVRLASRDPVVGRLRAEFLAGTGHMSAAAAAAEEALRLPPDGTAEETLALVARAADYRYELGEERLARPHLLALTNERPDASSFYRLGICHLRIGETLDDLDAAAAAFAASAQLDGGDLEARMAVGRAWLRGVELAREAGDQGAEALRAERAVQAFADAVSAFPAALEPRFGRAVALERSGKTAEAWRAYEALLEVHPRHLGTLLNLGALLAAGSENDPARRAQAESMLRRALEIGAERPDALSADERRRIEQYLKRP